MQKIILIRHGETEWALKDRHTGRTDIPLTEKGQLEAKSLAPILNNFPFEKAFVSPLQRARDTFKLSSGLVKPEIDDDLYEWNYGDYEGLTSAEIHQSNPNWSIFTQGAPGGESIDQVEERASRILEKAKKCTSDVAFFSSGHILRAIACKYLNLPISAGKYFVLSTASISILGYEHKNPALLLWNRTLP
jgi:broad specificity phosphatase PhoE